MYTVSIVTLFACALVAVYADDVALQKKVEGYIDDFVQKATNGSGGFIDPLTLEDIGKSFEKEIAFVTVKGEAKLFNGSMTGLTSLTRKGKCSVIDLDDMILITTQLTFKNLHANYKGALLINDAGPQFTLSAKIGGSKVTMVIVVPSEGGKADLMSFNIDNLRDIRVSIRGLGPLGWSASLISTVAMNALQKPVAKAASLKIFDHFSKEIEKYPFPGKAEVY